MTEDIVTPRLSAEGVRAAVDVRLDHEAMLRALEQGLGAVAPRWDAPVA